MKVAHWRGWNRFPILCGLAFALLLALGGPCAFGAFSIATDALRREFSTGVAFDGTNYLVIVEDATSSGSNSVITAQLVSPAGTLVGGRIQVGRTGGGIRVAYGAGRYLMVWSDDATSPDKMYGQFVSPTGSLIGAPFLILDAESKRSDIAFDGANFLVVCNIQEGNLVATFVSPAGGVGSEMVCAAPPHDGRDVAVAFNGTKYLVAWQDGSGLGALDNSVRGVFVSTNGTVSSPMTISQNLSLDHNPLTVGSDGANFLLAWPYNTAVDAEGDPISQLRGRIVTPGGTFPGAEFGIAGTTNNPFFPQIAFDGTDYLLTWTDRSVETNYNVSGRFISRNGALLGSGLNLISAAGNQGISPVAFGAGKYLVVWSDGIDWDSGTPGADVQGLIIVPSPFADATDLGGGWKWLSWFGYFHDAGNGWIYHQQHHWMYKVGTTPASIWFWTQDLGWLWTKSTTYPYLYRNTGPAWLWYQVGSSGPRWFNNLTTGHWESH